MAATLRVLPSTQKKSILVIVASFEVSAREVSWWKVTDQGSSIAGQNSPSIEQTSAQLAVGADDYWAFRRELLRTAEAKFNSVIHRWAQLLLASNVPFGRL